jgi:nucleoside-diphosphate-sugar epimerase
MSGSFFRNKKILVTGGAGFIGSHLTKKLFDMGARVTVIDNLSRGTKINLRGVLDKVNFIQADLCNESECQKYFEDIEIVFNLAALNTGVDYDLGRTEVMFEDNMLLQMIPLRMANKSQSVKKFIQISSASVYSRHAMDYQVPTPEDADTTSPEESKLGYALAKKMGEHLSIWYNSNNKIDTFIARFINVYGENDSYDAKGHFIPVMIRKFIESTEVVNVFGSGNQRRSFMYVEDAVAGLLVIAEKGSPGEVYNVDSGCERSVKEVVMEIVNYFNDKELEVFFDITKPEGSKRRMLDSSKLSSLGWNPKISFEVGLKRTVEDIIKNYNEKNDKNSRSKS